jgi:catechol 2,3-dioxygenase-like lactoylglutathione lyase family enzyme
MAISNDYFHVGIIVSDLDEAQEVLGRQLGLDWWDEPNQNVYDGSVLRVCYSLGEPPFVELVQGVPGGGWEPSAAPRIDHLGYWSDDLENDRDDLVARGMPVDIDGLAHGTRFTYHRADNGGFRVELVDVVYREGLLARCKPLGRSRAE